jgi:oligopeptidase B
MNASQSADQNNKTSKNNNTNETNESAAEDEGNVAASNVEMLAPVAPKRPVTASLHGHDRVDEYAWFRERENAEVLQHLEAENAYTAAVMASTKELQEELFSEIKARILETDLSVPTVKGPYAYFSRTEEGRQYGIHCRRAATSADTGIDAWPEGHLQPSEFELLLDENILADGHEFFSLGTFEVSPDHQLLAYATDTEGDEIYALRIRDLRTGVDLPDVIEESSPGVAWSADGSVLFYTTLDETMRPWKLWRHVLGTDAELDVCVFTEVDERFFLNLSTSTTDELIVVTLGSQITTEVHVLRADNPYADFVLFDERRQGIEYAIEHHRALDGSQRYFVLTNDGAEDFTLLVAPVNANGTASKRSSWLDAAIGDGPTPAGEVALLRSPKLDAIEVFQSHLVVHERANGTERLRVIALNSDGSLGEQHVLAQPEAVHSVWPAGNARFATSVLRFGYTSLTTPTSLEDYDMATRERIIRKRQPVLGAFQSETYVAERVWATANDGTQVPMSVVRHRDTPLDGTAPGLLYGYGSYEISIDPGFSSLRLCLLDRGFVFAIAHIRGGGEMGRHWYLHGKFLQKRNTFDDFIACAETLHSKGYVAPDRLVARGGSAGGLLMGAVVNQRPDLFAGIVAEVPFVDVVTTMLDDTLPLTAIEWEEWGNPADPEFYAYMRSYAPYENVSAQSYPPMLITAGLNDPRVSYWEPAKWVQRLRENNQPSPSNLKTTNTTLQTTTTDTDTATTTTTTTNRILLKTEMGAGHGGPSGRYDTWRDEAMVFAFILRCVGLAPQ